jgi:hypothetical protein
MTYLLIYLEFIDQIIVNRNKRRDPMQHSPIFLCPKSSTPIVNGPHAKILVSALECQGP